jgi:hypothetical protein
LEGLDSGIVGQPVGQITGLFPERTRKARLELLVITGLDPVIHLSRKSPMKIDGCPDQVRA